MGWANCGKDDLGRPIGYAVEATCDFKDKLDIRCIRRIDRGLSYVCGGMHGGDGIGCGRYFCGEHLIGVSPQLCVDCLEKVIKAAEDDGYYGYFKGKNLADNPNKPGTCEYDAWEDGWNMAEDGADKSKR